MDYYNPYHHKMDARKHTMNPMITGTSILGVKYDGGVMLAADTLGSYGSLARFRNISRMHTVNDQTVVAATGDYADFQFLIEDLTELQIENDEVQDNHRVSPSAVYSYLGRVMYNRRTKFNPLWNELVIAGFDNGKGLLGYVDKIGSMYESHVIGTGYGAYIALPLLRKATEEKPNMSKEEARKLLEDCMRVLFYRDARSFNKIEIADISADGVNVTPLSLDTNWSIANMIQGYS